MSTIRFFRVRGESDEKRADFERKCVVALLKRLRRTHDPKIIKNLKSALKSKSYKSSCITIPKSLDGRIQVRISGKFCQMGSNEAIHFPISGAQ